jgi:hypothetical protein
MSSVRSSLSLFCAVASSSCNGGAVMDSMRESASVTTLSCPDMSYVCRELCYVVQVVELPQ